LGREPAKSAEIDELISGFAATILRQVFLQIGRFPNRGTEESVSLNERIGG